MVSAHVVSLKGAVLDWVIQAMCSGFGAIGTLWSDDFGSPIQEAAIVDVLTEISNLRGSRGTLLEHSRVESDLLRR